MLKLNLKFKRIPFSLIYIFSYYKFIFIFIYFSFKITNNFLEARKILIISFDINKLYINKNLFSRQHGFIPISYRSANKIIFLESIITISTEKVESQYWL